MIRKLVNPKVILVTGGAGFIGSHTAKALFWHGYRPVVFDNLSSGRREAVQWGDFVHGDIRDRGAVSRAVADHRPSAVIHFAGLTGVAHSVSRPDLFFDNNVGGTAALLSAMNDHGVGRLVLCSSADVYGDGGGLGQEALREDAVKTPVSPYGETKLVAERMVEAHCRAFGITAVALRCFDVAGSDPEAELVEGHEPTTHLVPRAIAAALGEGGPLTVSGRDFDTPDGSCVRDFVHVEDVALAHVAAVEAVLPSGAFEAFNVGAGRGSSVLEVIGEVDRALATSTLYLVGGRREGDTAWRVADTSKIASRLGWTARGSSLKRIVATAAAWRRAPLFEVEAPPKSARAFISAAAPKVVRIDARDACEPS